MAATTEAVAQKYIGTKIIKAEPCAAWKQSGKWGVGADGYRVQYDDGYVSWSPKDIFEAAYRPTNGMPFGLALEAMKKGAKVSLLDATFYYFYDNGFFVSTWASNKVDKVAHFTELEIISDDWMIVE